MTDGMTISQGSTRPAVPHGQCDPDRTFSNLVDRAIRGQATDAEVAMLLSPEIVHRYRDALSHAQKSIEARDVAWRQRVELSEPGSFNRRCVTRDRAQWQARTAHVRSAIMDRQSEVRAVIRQMNIERSAVFGDLAERVRALEEAVSSIAARIGGAP